MNNEKSTLCTLICRILITLLILIPSVKNSLTTFLEKSEVTKDDINLKSAGFNYFASPIFFGSLGGGTLLMAVVIIVCICCKKKTVPPPQENVVVKQNEPVTKINEKSTNIKAGTYFCR